MLRLADASIRTVLGLVFGSSSALLLSLVLGDLMHSVDNRSNARRVATSTVTSKELFRSMLALRVERGGMIGGLASELPLTAVTRDAMLAQRSISETAYVESLHRLAVLNIDQLANPVADLRRAHEKVVALRDKIDVAIQLPKQLRDPQLEQAGPKEVQVMLDAILAVVTPLEESLKLYDPKVDQLLAVKQAAWTARGNLGEVTRLMLTTASAHRQLTTDEMVSWQRDRAIARGAWSIVTTATLRSDAPAALIKSVDAAKAAFNGQYDDQLQEVFAALSHGGEIAIPFADLYQRNRGIELSDRVLNVAMDEMVAQAEVSAQHAQQATIAAILMLVGGLILTIAGFIFVRGRIQQPILALTESINQLARQDFSVEIPAKTRDDEIGRMQAALLTLRENGRAQQIAVASANAALIHLARRDGLTGLYNRRHFDELLEIEWRRSSREHTPVSLLMIDVDFFKRFNDHYGHPEGDECLKRVAETLKAASTRATDVAARYGGEEFVVLLPATDADAAAEIARQIWARVREMAIPHAGSSFGRVTLSIGIATGIANGAEPIGTLVAEADRGVYRAKAAGRDHVCWGDDRGPPREKTPAAVVA